MHRQQSLISSTGLHHSNRWPSEPPHVDVEASALICHIAFWKPFAPQTDDRPRRLTVINNLLDSIHQQYGHTLTQRLDAPGHASVVSIPPWHSMHVTLRFELHNEIVSLAIYIHHKERRPVYLQDPRLCLANGIKWGERSPRFPRLSGECREAGDQLGTKKCDGFGKHVFVLSPLSPYRLRSTLGYPEAFNSWSPTPSKG
jgi:hypothetical protein